MKTTVEIPDELFVAAKKAAAERRWSLKRLIEVALRKELNGGRAQRKISTAEFLRRLERHTQRLAWNSELDLSSRESMHAWLERQK
ncbi:MAG: hypothetical protein ACRD2H_07585 [Terriglobales bacterium]